MKNLILLLVLLLIASISNAQWQYVGAPHIDQSTNYYKYLYYYDLEINAKGDVFVGYYSTYSGENLLNFAKYDGNSWSQLPSAGSFATNTVHIVDIEVQGDNYYMAYSGAISGKEYVFVKKYNGSVWTQLGDSLILGTVGGGGSFDFLLDNNGVPTLLGVTGTIGGAKQVFQFAAGAWTSTYTFPSNNINVFKENTSIFDSQNKLYCIIQVYIYPSTNYTRIVKIDAGTATNVGDSIGGGTMNPNIKFDATGNPYLICNQLNSHYVQKVTAYKLNGSKWSSVADTSGAGIGNMMASDVSGDGKIVFNTQQTNTAKSVYFYNGGARFAMDSIILTGGSITPISDIVIPSGSDYVYALVPEVKTNIAQDFSVMKHLITASSGIHSTTNLSNSFSIYPNPSTRSVKLNYELLKGSATINIFNLNGQVVYNYIKKDNSDMTIHISTPGIYFVELINGEGFSKMQKLVIQ